MINCCDLCKTLVLTFAALLLSMGSLQAQTQPKCDLSKCSPEKRAECAKRCAASAALAASFSLTDFFFADAKTSKTNCQPANCNPAACKKTATAKLVATETKTATNYGDNIEENNTASKAKTTKKSCAAKCKKASASGKRMK